MHLNMWCIYSSVDGINSRENVAATATRESKELQTARRHITSQADNGPLKSILHDRRRTDCVDVTLHDSKQTAVSLCPAPAEQ